MGESKDGVRKDVRTILTLLCKVYPAAKVFPLLMDGTKSKTEMQTLVCGLDSSQNLSRTRSDLTRGLSLEVLRLVSGS
jgi:hypothetical protein